MEFLSDEDNGVGSSPTPTPTPSPSSLSSSSSSKEVEEEEEETTSSMDEALKMSDLMAVLPIKRGLSRIYSGKSQSFTSFASVSCIRDLSKTKRPICRKKINPRKMITKRPFKGSRGRRQGLGLPLTLRGSESFCGQG